MSEDPRLRLDRLLREFRAGKLNTQSFCDQFEQTYNLEVDKASLSPLEAAAFRALFDRVVWYSPFPDERRNIPNYLGEAEIARAAEDAARALGIV